MKRQSKDQLYARELMRKHSFVPVLATVVVLLLLVALTLYLKHANGPDSGINTRTETLARCKPEQALRVAMEQLTEKWLTGEALYAQDLELVVRGSDGTVERLILTVFDPTIQTNYRIEVTSAEDDETALTVFIWAQRPETEKIAASVNATPVSLLIELFACFTQEAGTETLLQSGAYTHCGGTLMGADGAEVRDDAQLLYEDGVLRQRGSEELEQGARYALLTLSGEKTAVEATTQGTSCLLALPEKAEKE